MYLCRGFKKENMIQYRKSDGTLGEFDSDKLYEITTNGRVFTITLRSFGWDEYDVYYDTIDDVIEIRI